jgi:branched-chain amino acid transport system substrate-binding protein
MERWKGLLGLVIVTALLVSPAVPGRAAQPYEIDAILSLTGNVAFVGATQQRALRALEQYVNQHGGIEGRALTFVFADDQSNPQTAVLLAQGIIAKGVPVILGPSGPGSCSAIAPLVAQNGPVLYCLTNGGDIPPGGYEFLTLMSYDAQAAVELRYFRERGLHRIAYIVASDAGGQAVERALLAAAARPENKALEIVAREHFANSDLSVDAQMTQIKGARPDALVAWGTGPPAGTLFRGAQDVGLDVPTVSSPGNLTAAFFKQYAAVLPTNLYFPAVPYYANNAPTTPATRSAVAALTDAMASIGSKPDMLAISAWDPAMLVVDALRKLKPGVSADKLRAYLGGLRGWTGADGPYDFPANPQRGIGERNVVIVRWDAQRETGTAVSAMGGEPLRDR